MLDDIYIHFGIDKSKLKRDYIKNPLIKRSGNISGERPIKEDVEYLYTVLKLSQQDMAMIFDRDSRFVRKVLKEFNIKIRKPNKIPYEDLYNDYILNNFTLEELSIKYDISARTIRSWLKTYKINKPMVLSVENRKMKNIEKYGVSSFMKTDAGKRKIKDSMNKIYGVDNASQLPEVQKKKKENCKIRTGYNWYSQIPEHKLKIKKTLKEKYGDENFVNTKKFKETCITKYGVENVSCDESVKDKKAATFLEKYGNITYLQSAIGKEKIKKVNLEKYGVDHYSKSSEFKKMWMNKEFVKTIQEKIHNTMRKNKTAGISKQEDKIFELLIKKYDGVIRYYKSEKYPYYCDFYIPSIDTYIEYQGYWKHGVEPYIGTPEQENIIKEWVYRSKEKNYKNEYKKEYIDAINRWTIKDVEKRDCAKRNNLNWLEFFNMKEFMNWYDELI